MNKLFKTSSAIAPMILVSMAAQANNGSFAEVYDFQHTINPTSCSITSTNNTQIMGFVAAPSLPLTGTKLLSEFTGNQAPLATELRVACGATISVAFTVTDNRANTNAVPIPDGTFGLGEGEFAGNSGETRPIGYYKLKLTKVTTDGGSDIPGVLQTRPDINTGWANDLDGYLSPGTDHYSWSGTNTTPQETIKLSLLPEVTLNGQDVLQITATHAIDASYTTTVVF